MTLTEAINSGKKFKRSGGSSFKTAEAFLTGGISMADYSATDFILEPVSVKVKHAVLIEAWNEAKGSRTTVAAAEQSNFFRDFKTSLASRGVEIVS